MSPGTCPELVSTKLQAIVNLKNLHSTKVGSLGLLFYSTIDGHHEHRRHDCATYTVACAHLYVSFGSGPAVRHNRAGRNRDITFQGFNQVCLFSRVGPGQPLEMGQFHQGLDSDLNTRNQLLLLSVFFEGHHPPRAWKGREDQPNTVKGAWLGQLALTHQISAHRKFVVCSVISALCTAVMVERSDTT